MNRAQLHLMITVDELSDRDHLINDGCINKYPVFMMMAIQSELQIEIQQVLVTTAKVDSEPLETIRMSERAISEV